MEYVPVCDERGVLTGEIKSRSDVHRNGDWHPTVDVWLLNSRGELLLQQRSAQKEGNPLKWNSSAAGHVTAGTTPLFTARQETLEELGLDLPEERFSFLFTTQEVFYFPDRPNPARELAHVFLAEVNVRVEHLLLQVEEVAEAVWVPIKELERRVKDADPVLVPHDEQYRRLFAYLDRYLKPAII